MFDLHIQKLRLPKFWTNYGELPANLTTGFFSVNRREKIKEWLPIANRFDKLIYTAKHNYASFNISNWELNYWRRNVNFNSYPSSSCNDTVNCGTLWVKPDFVYLESYQFCAPPMNRPSFYTCTKSHFCNFGKFSQI